MYNFYTPYKYIFCLLICLGSAIHPAYREYRAAASLPAGKAAYPFGILQFKTLEQSDWLPGLYGYLDFDTEALYLESGFAPLGTKQLPRIGGRAKGHAFDWQNLNHITDETTGREQNRQALKSQYLGGDVFIGAAYSAWVARIGMGAETSHLTPRNRNSDLGSSSLSWNYVYTLSGYYRHYPYLPDFMLGDSLMASYTAYSLLGGRSPYAPQEETASFQQAALTGKVAFFIPGALVKFEQRLAALSFAAPGQSADQIRAWGVGGPEAAYGRIAGFAFTEYRAPVFSLTNLDMLIPVFHNWHLWLVSDIFLSDRKYAGRKTHFGSGIGMYYLLPRQPEQERSPLALFLRLDRGHSAGRNTALDRWQIFAGISGFSF